MHAQTSLSWDTEPQACAETARPHASVRCFLELVSFFFTLACDLLMGSLLSLNNSAPTVSPLLLIWGHKNWKLLEGDFQPHSHLETLILLHIGLPLNSSLWLSDSSVT